MTPVDELALAKLRTKNFNFTEKELQFLIDLGAEYLEDVYSGRRTNFPISKKLLANHEG